jgi:Fic family protein
MVTLLSFLAGIFVGAIGAYLLLGKRKTSGSIAAYTDQRSREKQNRKERLMTVVKERGTITNNDVEELLNIADSTATNYLQELEREGKIEQIGTQGRFVHYKIR